MVNLAVLDYSWRYHYECMVLDIEIKDYVCIYVTYFLAQFMKGSRSNGIISPVSSPSAILVSK